MEHFDSNNYHAPSVHSSSAYSSSAIGRKPQPIGVAPTFSAAPLPPYSTTTTTATIPMTTTTVTSSQQVAKSHQSPLVVASTAATTPQPTVESRSMATPHAIVTSNVSNTSNVVTTTRSTTVNLPDFAAQYNLPDNAYQMETRKVSSVVIESTPLASMPREEEIRYVDVPTVEEQVTYVTVKEVREVERRVPKHDVQYVERVVEVPKVIYTDIPKEVVRVEERVIEKKVPVVQDRLVEKIVERRVPKTRVVEQIKEVPGPIVEVAKYMPTEKKVDVVRHVDHEVPVVVAQTVKPIISEGKNHVNVDVLDCEPEVVPVDVHVAKPVQSSLELIGQVDQRHRLVNITSGQYNTILKLLNQHMDARSRSTLPFVSEAGKVPFIPEHEAQFILAPADVEIEGWNRPVTHRSNPSQVLPATRDVISSYTTSQQIPTNPRDARCCGVSGRMKHQPTPLGEHTGSAMRSSHVLAQSDCHSSIRPQPKHSHLSTADSHPHHHHHQGSQHHHAADANTQHDIHHHHHHEQHVGEHHVSSAVHDEGRYQSRSLHTESASALLNDHHRNPGSVAEVSHGGANPRRRVCC